MASLLMVSGILMVPAAATVLLEPPQAAQAAVVAGDVIFEYRSSANDPAQIARRESNGTITVLTSDTYGDYNPDVCSDGSQIVVSSQRWDATSQSIYWNIVLMNSDGSGQRELTHNGSPSNYADVQPRFSPDCTKVVFKRYYVEHDIWVVNVDGTGLTKLTDDEAVDNSGDPTWSPDGSKIAYSHVEDMGYIWQIWVMDSNGANKHPVDSGTPPASESFPVWVSTNKMYFASWYGGDALFYMTSSNGFASAGSPTRTGISGPAPGGAVSPNAGDTSLVYEGWDNSTSHPQLQQISSSGGTVTPITSGSIFASYPTYVKATYPATNAETIVALGDSVAAGEGTNYGWMWDGDSWVRTEPETPAWSDTTEATGFPYPQCHQSGYAYSRLLYADGYNVFNMACSGASAWDGLLTNQPFGGTSVPAQLGGDCTGCEEPNWYFDQHDPDAAIVTIGGNDIDFAGWITECYQPISIGCNSTTNTSTLDGQLTTAQLKLRLVLAELDRRADKELNKTLRVLVTNYYNPFPSGEVSTDCIDTGAGILDGTFEHIGISTAEKAWLSSGLSDLNTNIAAEVTYAQTHNTHLNIDLVDISTAMNGHEFCTTDPWVYGPSIAYPIAGETYSPAPFHPTPAGQRKIYELVKATL